MTMTSTPKTLLDLIAGGEPNHPAIIVPDGPVVTYEALRSQVAELAAQLEAAGISGGDRVAIVLPNGIEMIVSFLAVASIATAAPLNPAYKADEFDFYLGDTGAKALITSDSAGEEARAALDSFPDGAMRTALAESVEFAVRRGLRQQRHRRDRNAQKLRRRLPAVRRDERRVLHRR